MMEIQSKLWTRQQMIIPSSSPVIDVISHFKSPTSHPHSKENQNRITQQPSIEQRNTHRKTLSHRLQSSNHHKTPLHSTIPSQQMQPLKSHNHTFYSSPKPQSEPKSPPLSIQPPKHPEIPFSQQTHTFIS